eukprot:851350-Alexandrium_andersonii.AAC.1
MPVQNRPFMSGGIASTSFPRTAYIDVVVRSWLILWCGVVVWCGVAWCVMCSVVCIIVRCAVSGV